MRLPSTVGAIECNERSESYYYLRVIAPAVLELPEARERTTRPNPSLTAALAVTTIATVAIGVAAEPLLRLAEHSTMV